MAVEHADDPEIAEKPSAPDRRPPPPPDNPGSDEGPSRADSRAGAAAANEIADVGSDSPSASEQPSGVSEDLAGDDGAEAPATEQDEPLGDSGDPAVPDADASPTAADASVEEAAEVEDAPLRPDRARRQVTEPAENEPAAPSPAAVRPEREGRDRATGAEVSDGISAPTGRSVAREDAEGILTGGSAEQVVSSETDRATPDTAADRPVTTDDGGWEWKGLHLTPQDNAIADQAIDARRATEGRDVNGEYSDHGLTPEMRRIEQELAYGELVPDTEKYALKGADRFKEKLAKRIALEPDKPAQELAAEIHDGIRYTFTFPTEKYTPGVYDAESRLRRRGYELRQRKPSWGGSQYKGVNSRWQDPGSGQLFEVQFHTLESWEAKQKTHHAYATIENPEASEAEKATARKYQQDVSAGIPIPDGAGEISPYEDEGR
ncbi:hypothetical protein NE236_24730 [Actinoallomurus purpureus]|uniref:hypothetical protein n=1 Tax=Actinoallomurus purpureus TaxID=478114 RepID=UPI0020930306|nr:hypothetical protein [Actinoallomurus purpureus]MCO6008189.1 hypothetical protein [Actinoallomurus purpureus]